MTNEQLRSEVVAGIDAVIDAPRVVRWMLSAQKLRLLRALRAFALDADDATLAKLMTKLEREPVSASGECACDRACLLECAAAHLPIDEGGRLAANILDRFYGMHGGADAVSGFCSELSEVVAAEVLVGLRGQVGG